MASVWVNWRCSIPTKKFGVAKAAYWPGRLRVARWLHKNNDQWAISHIKFKWSTKQQIINEKIENLKLKFQNGNLETFDYLYMICNLFDNIKI